MKSAAIFATERVNKFSKDYQGWDGYLNDVLLDAKRFNTFLKSKSFAPTLYLNKDYTSSNVVKALRNYAISSIKDDLVVLYISGHGTQRYDTSGDEEDGLDEGVCAYDKILYDDDIFIELAKFKEGVNVLFVLDTCHSGTMLRLFDKAKQSKSIFSEVGKFFKGFFETKKEPTINANIVLLASSRESQYSQSTGKGGLFTNAFLSVVDKSKTLGDALLAANKIVIDFCNKTGSTGENLQEPVIMKLGKEPDKVLSLKF